MGETLSGSRGAQRRPPPAVSLRSFLMKVSFLRNENTELKENRKEIEKAEAKEVVFEFDIT